MYIMRGISESGKSTLALDNFRFKIKRTPGPKFHIQIGLIFDHKQKGGLAPDEFQNLSTTFFADQFKCDFETEPEAQAELKRLKEHILHRWDEITPRKII